MRIAFYSSLVLCAVLLYFMFDLNQEFPTDPGCDLSHDPILRLAFVESLYAIELANTQCKEKVLPVLKSHVSLDFIFILGYGILLATLIVRFVKNYGILAAILTGCVLLMCCADGIENMLMIKVATQYESRAYDLLNRMVMFKWVLFCFISIILALWTSTTGRSFRFIVITLSVASMYLLIFTVDHQTDVLTKHYITDIKLILGVHLLALFVAIVAAASSDIRIVGRAMN